MIIVMIYCIKKPEDEEYYNIKREKLLWDTEIHILIEMTHMIIIMVGIHVKMWQKIQKRRHGYRPYNSAEIWRTRFRMEFTVHM